MTTGADLTVLADASTALLHVAQSLRDQSRSTASALDALRTGAPQAEARSALADADAALAPLLRLLRDTARVLSDDAAEQHARFGFADRR